MCLDDDVAAGMFSYSSSSTPVVITTPPVVVIPPVVIIPPVITIPPGAPIKSATLIMDYTNTFPIANQEITADGMYTEIPFTDSTSRSAVENKFIRFYLFTGERRAIYDKGIQIFHGPMLLPFEQAMNASKPTLVPTIIPIVNVVMKNTNPIVPANFPTINFFVRNARAISNFGNSCYFGSAMQLLFVMFNITNDIITKWKFPVPLDKAHLPLIGDLLNKMKSTITLPNVGNPISAGNTNPLLDFFIGHYRTIKSHIYGNTNMTEEDPLTFLLNVIKNLSPVAKPWVEEDIDEVRYHVLKPNTKVEVTTDDRPIFPIYFKNIQTNPNGELQDLMYDCYLHLDFRDGPTTATRDVAGKNQAIFAYNFIEITKLPTYLLIELQYTNHIDVIEHNIQINLTLDLKVGSQQIKYFFMGAIIYDEVSGAKHYNSLIFDQIEETKDVHGNIIARGFKYLYYDDAIVKTHKLDIQPANRIIPANYFYRDGIAKNAKEIPYILLYADITQLK